MPGRHDSLAPELDGWAPTALRAVVACTPPTSLAAALGLAGGGYLTGREDVAAFGAVAGAVGLMAERVHSRGVRRRLRRERARRREDLRAISRDVGEVQRQLGALRADLDDVRAERDVFREQLVREQLGRDRLVQEAALARRSLRPEPITIAPVEAASVEAASVEVEVAVTEPIELDRAASAPAGMPRQTRSPIATGGIPVLVPGPSEPVQIIDLRWSGPAAAAPQALPADVADDLVYAALAAAEADELTRVLEDPGARPGRGAGRLHAGDAHRAGNYARGDVTDPGGAPVLFVVRRGRHVA